MKSCFFSFEFSFRIYPSKAIGNVSNLKTKLQEFKKHFIQTQKGPRIPPRPFFKQHILFIPVSYPSNGLA